MNAPFFSLVSGVVEVLFYMLLLYIDIWFAFKLFAVTGGHFLLSNQCYGLSQDFVG